MSERFEDHHHNNNGIKFLAKKVSDNLPIYAKDATKKDGPFYCPYDYEPLIVKKCTEKQDHFAYYGRLSSVYGSGESDLHLDCKNEICDKLKEIFPDGNWAVERPIPADKDLGLRELKPDISGRINKKAIVIEVQKSTLTIEQIIDRTDNYKKRKCNLLWIIPLNEELGTENFRPRLYEHYLHSMYFGRVYYWVKGYGCSLKPVHFDPTERYIEESVWFEAGGTERSGGGFYKTYKTIFKPNYGKTLNIATDFNPESRQKFVPDNEKKTIPEFNIYIDNLRFWWKK